MPRPKKPGAPEPKKRSRNGCWPCKSRKVKCDERRPICANCEKQGETCDYSIRLNWEGRGKRQAQPWVGEGQFNFSSETGSGSLGVPTAGNSGAATTPTTSSTATQSETYAGRFQQVEAKRSPISSPGNYSVQTHGSRISISASSSPQAPQVISTIDPALATPLRSPHILYQEGVYRNIEIREQQHAQSFERYNPAVSATLPASQPAFSRVRQVSVKDEPLMSPSDSGSSRSFNLHNHEGSNHNSPFGSGKDDGEATGPDQTSLDRPTKRVRTDQPRQASSPYNSAMPPPTMSSYQPSTIESQSSNIIINTPLSQVSTPLTPASSHSDDTSKAYIPALSPQQVTQDSPDLRRLSVSSLLSGPSTGSYQSNRTYGSNSLPEAVMWPLQTPAAYEDTENFGTDRGFQDLDIGKNDDANAISGASPAALRHHLELDRETGLSPVEFGFGMQMNAAFEGGSYYDKPISVCIPRVLKPLPSKLHENPMNLLYFHHFINHTAGCLVPHNCSSNPFKIILPQMAVQDDNLLNLLLAYSASHRARLLRQPEPLIRITQYVEGIFSNLGNALNDPSSISNANLATAIMLASLDIISPKVFGNATIPWQLHLGLARQMIAAIGGPRKMKTASRDDRVSSFLWSWFAYLDILGSFTGVKSDHASPSFIFDYDTDHENVYQIDCILGFTSRCVALLAKTAELARKCDSERLALDFKSRSEWHPSAEVIQRAEKLVIDLAASRLHPARPCAHMRSNGEAAYQLDALETRATNEAFHSACLVHLHRRVLGKSSTHIDVRNAVQETLIALYKVRKGSSAEACLIFPMFTAGCEAQDEDQRADILERVKTVERYGMTQVHKARTLMERVWQTGQPWETLVAGEFVG